MMDVDKVLKERMQAGLLEQYVLGLCTREEKKAIESLAAKDAETAELVLRMRKALDCYCTTCNKPKVHSIVKAKESANPDHERSKKPRGKLISLNCDRKSAGKSQIQSFFRKIKGWIGEDSDGFQS